MTFDPNNNGEEKAVQMLRSTNFENFPQVSEVEQGMAQWYRSPFHASRQRFEPIQFLPAVKSLKQASKASANKKTNK